MHNDSYNSPYLMEWILNLNLHKFRYRHTSGCAFRYSQLPLRSCFCIRGNLLYRFMAFESHLPRSSILDCGTCPFSDIIILQFGFCAKNLKMYFKLKRKPAYKDLRIWIKLPHRIANITAYCILCSPVSWFPNIR